MASSEIASRLGAMVNPTVTNPVWMEGVINPGESFLGESNEAGEFAWQDWSEKVKEQTEESLEKAGLLKALETQDFQLLMQSLSQQINEFALFSYDNFPIKYYAEFVENVLPYQDLGFEQGNVHWAVQSGDIPLAISNGLMTGKSSEKFGPDDVLKRAEAAQTLFRLSGESDPEKIASYSGPSSFTDVNSAAWYGPALNWASQNQIFVGSNGQARPDDPISKEELTTVLYRYAQKILADTSDKPDTTYTKTPDASSVADFAQKAMEWAFDNGLITGNEPSKNLDPKGNTKRGEYAKILANATTVLDK